MQADMAREAGIYGFCYYHYWFNGKQLMQRPVEEILSSGEPDYPFMLCWANDRIFKPNISIMKRLYEYGDYINYRLSQPMKDYKCYPCVSSGWDNSPRRVGKGFLAFKNSTPELFKKWLSDTLNRFEAYSNEENLVFINAWNEWAEGNHLEPDQKWGHAFLDVTKEAIEEYEKR